MEPLDPALAELIATETETGAPPQGAKARAWAAIGAGLGGVPLAVPVGGADAATATAAPAIANFLCPPVAGSGCAGAPVDGLGHSANAVVGGVGTAGAGHVGCGPGVRVEPCGLWIEPCGL